jgi:Tfp pilus assembly protein PilO
MTNNAATQPNSDEINEANRPNAIAVANQISSRDSQSQIDEVQRKIRNNKVMFYGYPILIILYAIGIVLFIIVPTFQRFFTVQQEDLVLDQNILNISQTAINLNNAINNLPTLDSYETQLSEYIPTDARVGQLISIIQKQANDFGLERQDIATTDTNSSQNQTSVGSLAQTDSSSNALFQTISSGEIEFTPKSISTDAKARLLAIDITVKGSKDNFFKFLEALKTVRPIINLISIEYQETPSTDTSSVITANLRFESYALKLNDSKKITTPRKYTIEDSILTSVISVENFKVSGQMEKILTPTVTATPTTTR